MPKKIWLIFFLNLLFLLPIVGVKAADNCCWRNTNGTYEASSAASEDICKSYCSNPDNNCTFFSYDTTENFKCVLSGSSDTVKKTDYISPVLNVNIPGISFSKILESNGYIEINWLSEYISGMYKFLLGISAIFAVLMLMVGGLQYVVSPGGAGAASAKKRITNAITGMVLLFCVYLILYTVNPNLTVFEGLVIKSIDPLYDVIDQDNRDAVGTVSTNNIPGEIICPKTAGVNTIEEIAKSFVGKVAYRYGGGHPGTPPYAEKPDKYCGDKLCKDFCPEGNICLDCSGFVNMVRACAGLSQNAGGTAGMSSTSEKISECTNTSVNGKELTPGDRILWRGADEGKPGQGHVIIYIGNGQTAESVGSGRAAGSAIKIRSFSVTCKNIKSHTYRIVKDS